MDKQRTDTTTKRPVIDPGRKHDAIEKIRELVAIYKPRIDRSGVVSTPSQHRSSSRRSRAVG